MENLLSHKSLHRAKIILVFVLSFCLVLGYEFSVCATEGDNIGVETYGDREKEELEHLLFAKLVYDYLDGYEGKTVEEYVNDNPDLYEGEIWEESGVTYKEIYNLVVGEWEIYKICNNNTDTGFYGVAFRNGDRVIIAFRGSEMFTDEFALDESNDWTGTDMKFALFNELSNQFSDADHFYRDTLYSLKMEGMTEEQLEITLTGHSLGGALCAYESLICGKYAYSFDGACGHVIDLAYYYGYLDIDDFSGVDDLDNIAFCNYTDDTGYVVADLIQHTCAEYMYQVDRDTNLDGLVENTLIPQAADAGSHIIWSTLRAEDGVVSFTPQVNVEDGYYTYQPLGPVYLDITKNVIETGMENVDFQTPWNIIDYQNLDYEELAGSVTGIVKNGRVVLASIDGGVLTAYDGVAVNSAFDIDTVMYGGKGDDHLIGYVADDVLISGTGTDILDGNLGDDTYVIDKNPGHTTTITDIGGRRTDIILRNTNVKRLVIDDNNLINIGNKQFIDLDVATDSEDVHFYTYYNGKLKEICTLDKLNGDYLVSDFANKEKNVVILEGVGTFKICDKDGNVVETVTNDVDIDTVLEESEPTTSVTDYNFGMVYSNYSLGNPSLFIVIDENYDVKVDSYPGCDLAVGVIDENNKFIGCERKYSREFEDYLVKFDLAIAQGDGQGEFDWEDVIFGGLNLLDQLLGN